MAIRDAGNKEKSRRKTLDYRVDGRSRDATVEAVGGRHCRRRGRHSRGWILDIRVKNREFLNILKNLDKLKFKPQIQHEGEVL
jgi:hypothetical protein